MDLAKIVDHIKNHRTIERYVVLILALVGNIYK
jgi:hypothetical protein